MNNKLLLKLIDGCYDDANIGFDVSIDLLTHYSSGDIDLIHKGEDVVDGVLNEFSHPNSVSVEEAKDVGGFFEGAISYLSHGIPADPLLDTVGGFHTIDHYLDD